MKRTAFKASHLSEREKRQYIFEKRKSLTTERAKLRLPFKPEHITDEELKQGLAKLAA